MAASGLGINVINGVLSLCQGSGWHAHLSPAEVAEGAGGPAERKQGKNLCRIAARLQQDWSVGVINVVVFHFCDPLESNHDFFFPRLFHFWLFLREILTHCGQVAAQQKGKSPCSLLPTTCTFCFILVPHLGSPPPSAKKKTWIVFSERNHLIDLFSVCQHRHRRKGGILHPAGGEEKLRPWFTKQMAPGFSGQAAFPLAVTVKCTVLCHVGWYR